MPPEGGQSRYAIALVTYFTEQQWAGLTCHTSAWVLLTVTQPWVGLALVLGMAQQWASPTDGQHRADYCRVLPDVVSGT